MKKYLLVFLIAFVILSCNKSRETKIKEIKVGMLISVGGVGDKAFNDSAIDGLNQAIKEHKIQGKFIDYVDEKKNLENLRIFAEEGYDIIIGIGFFNLKAIETVALEYPEKNFSIIDLPSQNENIFSGVFQEEGAAFLVGVLAALKTKSNVIGFLGGAPIPVVKTVKDSYIAGAKYINPSIKIYSEMTGSFNDSEKGYFTAKSLYEKNCDIIFSAAGKTGIGAISVAKEYNKYFIGSDTNQIHLAPENILGCRMKNINVVILDMVKKYKENNFSGGINIYGLKENGLDLVLNDHIVFEQEIKKINEIKNQIVRKKLIIDDYIKKSE